MNELGPVTRAEKAEERLETMQRLAREYRDEWRYCQVLLAEASVALDEEGYAQLSGACHRASKGKMKSTDTQEEA